MHLSEMLFIKLGFFTVVCKKTSYENIQQIMINGECSPDTAVGEAGFSDHEK